MKKLSHSAKLLSGLLNVAFWLLIAWGLFHGGTILIGIINILTGGASGTMHISGVTVDYLQLKAAVGLELPSRSFLMMSMVSLGYYFLMIPLLCWGLQLLRNALTCMEQQRPFGACAVLRRLGWLSTALAVLCNLLNYARIYITEHVYRLEALFVGDTISAVTFRFCPDYTFVAAAVILFLLAAVFRYGEELQQLSDETL